MVQDLFLYMPKPFTFYNLPYHDYTLQHSQLLSELDIEYPTPTESSLNIQILLLPKNLVIQILCSSNTHSRLFKTKFNNYLWLWHKNQVSKRKKKENVKVEL